MALTEEQQKAWVEQWRAAGPELDRVWKAELRALTPDRARQMVADVMRLVDAFPRSATVRSTGLIEMQRLLHER